MQLLAFYLSQGLVWVCELELSHMGKNNGIPDLVCEKFWYCNLHILSVCMCTHFVIRGCLIFIRAVIINVINHWGQNTNVIKKVDCKKPVQCTDFIFCFIFCHDCRNKVVVNDLQ